MTELHRLGSSNTVSAHYTVCDLNSTVGMRQCAIKHLSEYKQPLNRAVPHVK